MFKKLLSALTVMLFVFGMNAGAQELQKADFGFMPKSPAKNVMTSHIEMSGTEMWTGYWNGELKNEKPQVIGVEQTPLDYGVAVCYPAGSKELEGKTIEGIKFGFADVTYIKNVRIFIGTELPDLYKSADICTDDVKEIVDIQNENGDVMNEVRFSKPYRVNPDKPVYVGYIFNVVSSSDQAALYPIYTQKVADKENALILNFANQGWDDYYGSNFGVATIQVLVSGGSYEANDVAIKLENSIIGSKESFDIPVTLSNFGTEPLSSFELEFDINGVKTTYSETLKKPVSGIGEEYKFKVKANTPSQSGNFNYTVKATKVNGVAMTKDIVGKGKIMILSRNAQRRVLLEEFTGFWCRNCPRGYVALQKINQVYGDKVTLIAVHGDDPLACSDYLPVMKQVPGFPAAMVDRTLKNIDPFSGSNSTVFGIFKDIDKCMAKTSVAEVVSKPVISGDILSATAETKFMFTGDASDYAIGFVLTENGMKNDKWVQNNGLRGNKKYLEYDPLFEPWVNGAAGMKGLTYNEIAHAAKDIGAGMPESIPDYVEEEVAVKYTTEFNLNDYNQIQNRENLNVVVILFDRNTAQVVNTAIAPVTIDASGIEEVEGGENAVEVARYTVDGRRINSAEKGVNIVKYSDGTVKKVLVR